jgi:hypothetical protein
MYETLGSTISSVEGFNNCLVQIYIRDRRPQLNHYVFDDNIFAAAKNIEEPEAVAAANCYLDNQSVH